MTDILSITQLNDIFKQELGSDLIQSQERKRKACSKEAFQLWLTIDKKAIKRVTQKIKNLNPEGFPFLSVISGCDTGEYVELNYHFFVYAGLKDRRETAIIVKTPLPKEDLTIDTITDIIPAAILSEKEKQDFFGIQVINMPDAKRMCFLPEDFPEGVYPWRKDDKGIPEEMVKKLYMVGRDKAKEKLPKAVSSESDKTEQPEQDQNKVNDEGNN